MSVSAAYSDPNSLVPVLPSERADSAAASREKSQHLSMFAEGDDSPSFWDLVDVINPLQHIPVVNKIYQELTGDKIGVGARLAGSTLFGGPIGLIASAINCAIEEKTGKDAGGHLMAMFRDDSTASSTLAEAKPAAVAPQQVAAATIPASAAAGAPTIALPDVPAKANATGPMMFTSDGTLVNQPGPIPAAPTQASLTQASLTQAPPTQAAPPIQPVAVGKAMPLGGGQNRFMPLPQRTTISSTNAPPPISVPVSNSGIRSNVPITGRDPVANAPSAMAVQKAMAAQGLGTVQHPMLPPAAPTAAGPAAANADWYSSMGRALDKYERANNLAAKPAPTQNTLQ
jgi:hypothetical protein